jgi:alpha-D-ribose 1-methylphosphonate 5-triphosphate synthase subunit PhnG
MAICASASEAEMRAGLAAIAPFPAWTDLRPPELGLVMLRGRIGGDGAPFNLGEATVSRAAVRLASGEIGHGHVLGRDLERARCAALIDALGQVSEHRATLEHSLVAVVADRAARDRDRQAAQTAATRVDFFTMVRGDD